MSEKITFKEPAQGAIYMLAKGFKLFPVVPNDKSPQVKDWLGWGETSCKGAITAYALDTDSNWGIIPSLSGHLVIDVDCGYKMKGKKDAKQLVKANGTETLAKLEKKHGTMPPTLTVQTPSGGYHLYYKGTCRPTVGAVGEGIDTRSEESYVVAPGSTVPYYTADGKKVKGQYTVVRDMEPVECPLWFLGLLEEKKKSSQAASRKGEEGASTLDTERNIADAIDYLTDAPVCVEGDGTHGGEYLYQIFCKTRDFGVSKDQARTLVLQNYNDRCDPPWDMGDEADADHFNKKLRNAYTYAQNNIGVESHEARIKQAKKDFTRVPVEDTTSKIITPIHLNWVSGINPHETRKRRWIMQGRYASGETTAVVGPGGAGKSRLIMTDAVSIASGKSFDGFEVTQGRVLVYNLEDDREELKRRFEAICVHRGLSLSSVNDLAYLSGRDHPLILAHKKNGIAQENKDAVDQLIITLKQANISILFLDPFSRCYTVSENDNSEMNIVMTALSRIETETGCAVCIVHHASKAGANKESDSRDQDSSRGASAITNAARIVINVVRMSDSEAKRLGLEEDQHLYFKTVDAKANIFLRKSDITWYRLKSITLVNGKSSGSIELVDLEKSASFNEQLELEDQKKQVLAFLREKIRDGQKVPLRVLIAIAIERGLTIFCKHTTTCQKRLEELIGDRRDFLFSRGEKNSIVIIRNDVF